MEFGMITFLSDDSTPEMQIKFWYKKAAQVTTPNEDNYAGIRRLEGKRTKRT